MVSAEMCNGVVQVLPPVGSEAPSTRWAEPSVRLQTAVALPEESTATSGSLASFEVSEMSFGVVQSLAVAGSAAPSITKWVPCTRNTATALPSGSTATRASVAIPSGADTAFCALHVAEPAARRDASITVWTPSNCDQSAMASPRAPTATVVSKELCVSSDTGCGGPQVVEPAARVDVSTWLVEASCRYQIATALPCGSTSTCSLTEPKPSAERFCGAVQSPPAGRTDPCTM